MRCCHIFACIDVAMVDALYYRWLANATRHILGQYAIFLRGGCGYGSDGRIEG